MQSWVSYKSSIICDVEFRLCLCKSSLVFHPLRCEVTVWGSMLWFEHWSEWWRWLITSWHVVLESAKDSIWRVDTPGQQVSPRVRYGTTCLLIRYAIGCVSCSVEWGWSSFFVSFVWHTLWSTWTTWCKRGLWWGIHSTTSGAFYEESVAKHDILL
jgi:hypothetical protein